MNDKPALGKDAKTDAGAFVPSTQGRGFMPSRLRIMYQI